MSFGRILLLILQGALIGTGAILPGVSGGVLCAAFGIYEPMIAFLSHPIRSFKKYIRILLPVLIGGAIGFVLLAKAVELLLEFSPIAAMSLFCGLICGTVPDLAKKSVSSQPDKGWIAFILALMASFFMFRFLDSGITGHISANFWWYIFCGAIWGLSMVVPGLSSSSILLFMGLYQPMAHGIGSLDLTVLIPLGIGFLLTVAATARGVSILIERYAAFTSKIILGFVLSSVLIILPAPRSVNLQWLIGIGCFAVGFAVSIWMSTTKIGSDSVKS